VQKTFEVNSLTSVVQTLNHQDIKVFPNPVNETLYFQVENLKNEKVQIKVLNMLGEQIFEQDFNHTGQGSLKFELNTSGLKQGVYVYAINIDNQTTYGPFVKYTIR
jgi:hypothetical protein